MRLAKFLILSLLIHFLVLFWGNVPLKKQKSPKTFAQKGRVELKTARQEGARAERTGKPNIEAADFEPVVKEGPVRLRPNEISDVEEKKDLITEKKKDEKEGRENSKVMEEKPAEKALATKKSSKAGKAVKTPEKPESQAKEGKSSLAELTADEITEGKEVLKTKFQTKKDYQEYRKNMNVWQVDGLPVPDLIVIYSDEDEILSITHYFNLKLVVYGQKEDKEEPVVIEVEDAKIPTFRELYGIDEVNYSNRVRERKGDPFFDLLLANATEKFGVKKNSAHLISLIPNDVDLYFRYKQIECAKRNGIDPFSVKTTYAKYHLTDVGVWILAVERMKLKDGSTVTVRDFELDEVTG